MDTEKLVSLVRQAILAAMRNDSIYFQWENFAVTRTNEVQLRITQVTPDGNNKTWDVIFHENPGVNK